MSDTPTAAPEEIEGVDPQKNGTILVEFDDKKISLRRPKMGEYRKFREALEAINDILYDESFEVDLMKKTLEEFEEGDKSEGLSNEEVVDRAQRRLELQKKIRAHNRAIIAKMEDKRVEWMVDVIDTLSGSQLNLETDADLPAWFSQSATVTRMLEHWQTTPPARGVR